jgi:hypothetical protein
VIYAQKNAAQPALNTKKKTAEVSQGGLIYALIA